MTAWLQDTRRFSTVATHVKHCSVQESTSLRTSSRSGTFRSPSEKRHPAQFSRSNRTCSPADQPAGQATATHTTTGLPSVASSNTHHHQRGERPSGNQSTLFCCSTFPPRVDARR
uniref:(northern house mosquito) hypothetical protein n=1 Tax=Culex pipiens TaxID=7175 RepID=A0A8D8CSE9_CULPI